MLHWVLTIDTSEYRTFTDLEVHDTIPNGLCVLGAANYEPTGTPAECDPTGEVPQFRFGTSGAWTDIDYAGVTPISGGTYDVVFDKTATGLATPFGDTIRNPGALSGAGLGSSNSAVQIRIPTKVRRYYQTGNHNDNTSSPVLAKDLISNTATVDGVAHMRLDTNGNPLNGDRLSVEPLGTHITSAGASTEAPGVTFDKQVAKTSSSGVCPTDDASFSNSHNAYVPIGGSSPFYGTGDVVCWRIRSTFPVTNDTGAVGIDDFLPFGHIYVAGTAATTPLHTAGTWSLNWTAPPDTSSPGWLRWTLTSAPAVSNGGRVFEYTLKSRIVDPLIASPADVISNQAKLAYQNTLLDVFAERDLQDVGFLKAQIRAVKGVQTIERGVTVTTNNGTNANVDGGIVGIDDVVTYRVDVENTGNRDTVNTETWDRLPVQIDSCGLVSSISNAGSCSVDGGGRVWVKWPAALSVPACSLLPSTADPGYCAAAPFGPRQTPPKLTYKVTMPSLGANERLDNTVGIRGYQTTTNSGPNWTFIPNGNIDPTQDVIANDILNGIVHTDYPST